MGTAADVTWKPPTGRCRYKCQTCGEEFARWAPAARHADAHGGARLEIVIGTDAPE